MKYTVAQLVEALSAFDPDLPVSVDGYEYGYTERCHLEEIDVILLDDPPDYAGELDDPDSNPSKPTRRVLNIARGDPDDYDEGFPWQLKADPEIPSANP